MLRDCRKGTPVMSFQLILERDGEADEHLWLTIGQEGPWRCWLVLGKGKNLRVERGIIALYHTACGDLAATKGHSHASWGAYRWLAAIPAHRQQKSRRVLPLPPLQPQIHTDGWRCITYSHSISICDVFSLFWCGNAHSCHFWGNLCRGDL